MNSSTVIVKYNILHSNICVMKPHYYATWWDLTYVHTWPDLCTHIDKQCIMNMSWFYCITWLLNPTHIAICVGCYCSAYLTHVTWQYTLNIIGFCNCTYCMSNYYHKSQIMWLCCCCCCCCYYCLLMHCKGLTTWLARLVCFKYQMYV